jgi:hypothetical protein
MSRAQVDISGTESKMSTMLNHLYEVCSQLWGLSKAMNKRSVGRSAVMGVCFLLMASAGSGD